MGNNISGHISVEGCDFGNFLHQSGCTMNAQEILQSQRQSDFRNNIVSAHTVNGGINQEVSTELHKLTSKKNFIINELRDLWLNRGTANFLPPSKIYEINLGHIAKLEERGKFDTGTKQSKLPGKISYWKQDIPTSVLIRQQESFHI